jgi:hypothetical protein
VKKIRKNGFRLLTVPGEPTKIINTTHCYAMSCVEAASPYAARSSLTRRSARGRRMV